jgi:hypothetical protein
LFVVGRIDGGMVFALRKVSVFDRYRFSCHVEQFSDESQPVRQDQFFRVQVSGRIPTQQENVDTNVQIEVLDVTDGQSHAHQVLSQTDSRMLIRFSVPMNNTVTRRIPNFI